MFSSELSEELPLLLPLLLSESEPELLLESSFRDGWTGNGGMEIGAPPPLTPLPPNTGIDGGTAGQYNRGGQVCKRSSFAVRFTVVH